jgi:hypothetical protein
MTYLGSSPTSRLCNWPDRPVARAEWSEIVVYLEIMSILPIRYTTCDSFFLQRAMRDDRQGNFTLRHHPLIGKLLLGTLTSDFHLQITEIVANVNALIFTQLFRLILDPGKWLDWRRLLPERKNSVYLLLLCKWGTIIILPYSTVVL